MMADDGMVTLLAVDGARSKPSVAETSIKVLLGKLGKPECLLTTRLESTWRVRDKSQKSQRNRSRKNEHHRRRLKPIL